MNSDWATLSQVSDYRLLGSSGLFWVLLQFLLWDGLWFIVEGGNGTCRSLNYTVILVGGYHMDNHATSPIFIFLVQIGQISIKISSCQKQQSVLNCFFAGMIVK